jgi:hypothetical protein
MKGGMGAVEGQKLLAGMLYCPMCYTAMLQHTCNDESMATLQGVKG